MGLKMKFGAVHKFFRFAATHFSIVFRFSFLYDTAVLRLHEKSMKKIFFKKKNSCMRKKKAKQKINGYAAKMCVKGRSQITRFVRITSSPMFVFVQLFHFGYGLRVYAPHTSAVFFFNGTCKNFAQNCFSFARVCVCDTLNACCLQNHRVNTQTMP